MSDTSDMLTSDAAATFARHFFELVQANSNGEWVRYRDVYNRTVNDLPNNAFVIWLSGHPRRRAKVKFVLDSAAGGFPNVERRKDGPAQSSLVWFRVHGRIYHIVTDARVVERQFARWRKAMVQGGRWNDGICETPEGLVARTLPIQPGQTLGQRVALGYDAEGHDWTVQINQPSAPETHNVLSAVALTTDGRPALLRQGTLQANRRNSVRITGETFREATGLHPVPVLHNSEPSPRVWYAVAFLDQALVGIRRATVAFVERCDAA